MHIILGDQDSRNFGSFRDSFFSKIFFSISCLRLMGFPFTLGFYSKDYLLRQLSFYESSLIVYVFLLSCGFTVSYRLRLLYLGFLGNPRFSGSLSYKEQATFFLPVILLYLRCVFLGNFFAFNFLPPTTFSFVDMSLGIFIILLGVGLFKFT